MSEDENEDGKTIVPLSVKALSKYEKSAPGDLALCPPGPVIPSETFVKNVKFVDCKQNHIGPKIVASHVTVQLPEGKVGSTIVRKWLLVCFFATAALIAIALSLVSTLPPKYPAQDDDILNGGEHPPDWYYIREDRNVSECEEPPTRILRNHLVVDSLDRTCSDPSSCMELIQRLEEDTDFYLAGGRIYEGWGWNCRPRKRLRVVFLTGGRATHLDMFSFNGLVRMGIEMREIEPKYVVFPACCVEDSSPGPSRGVLLFLETLPTFKERDCLAKSQTCQSNN